MPQRAALALGLVLLALGLSSSPAGARGDLVHGPVVAQGASPGGVPWRIRAYRARVGGPDYATFAFVAKPPAVSDATYFTGLPLPISKRFLFTANQGSPGGPVPENDVSGIVDRRVQRLDCQLTDGTIVTADLIRPPANARSDLPWLRGLRTFDLFFGPDVYAEKLTAYDASGRELEEAGGGAGFYGQTD